MEIDHSETRATARRVAAEWQLELEEPFALSYASHVIAVGDDLVLKVSYAGDDESLDEAEALALWGPELAIRVIRADRGSRALLEERALPGTDLAALPQDEAVAVAVDLGRRLWRRAGPPFRRVTDHVPCWLRTTPSELTPLAEELLPALEVGSWLVHGCTTRASTSSPATTRRRASRGSSRRGSTTSRSEPGR